MTSNAPVVIGVVASAGGLAALKSMCSELDQLVGASMIVTQHVSPTYHD
ncbi:chemotaxis protein CheB [Abyssibacter sp.]